MIDRSESLLISMEARNRQRAASAKRRTVAPAPAGAVTTADAGGRRHAAVSRKAAARDAGPVRDTASGTR